MGTSGDRARSPCPGCWATARPSRLPIPQARPDWAAGSSVVCVDPSDPSCKMIQSTIVADASSNLSTGKGTFQATILVDLTPGGTCNIVDEPGAFIFDNGTIFTHSNHEDCAIHGLRIDTTFQVTGGTGAFDGATGGGREWASTGAASPVFFQGKITF
jgi:hypothetical protein